MLFVNQVAAIVHQCAWDSGGDPNKNIGDAFLLVWKIDDGEEAASSSSSSSAIDAVGSPSSSMKTQGVDSPLVTTDARIKRPLAAGGSKEAVGVGPAAPASETKPVCVYVCVCVCVRVCVCVCACACVCV